MLSVLVADHLPFEILGVPGWIMQSSKCTTCKDHTAAKAYELSPVIPAYYLHSSLNQKACASGQLCIEDIVNTMVFKTNEEKVDCHKCKRKNTRKVSVESLIARPQFLIQEVARFEVNGTTCSPRHTGRVKVPENGAIALSGDGASYFLTAVIFHTGVSPSSGHYWMATVNPHNPDEWWEINDELVNITSLPSMRDQMETNARLFVFKHGSQEPGTVWLLLGSSS